MVDFCIIFPNHPLSPSLCCLTHVRLGRGWFMALRVCVQQERAGRSYSMGMAAAGHWSLLGSVQMQTLGVDPLVMGGMLCSWPHLPVPGHLHPPTTGDTACPSARPSSPQAWALGGRAEGRPVLGRRGPAGGVPGLEPAQQGAVAFPTPAVGEAAPGSGPLFGPAARGWLHAPGHRPQVGPAWW